MKFENTSVNNFEGAFRGMRNPLASWERSDSSFDISHIDVMPDYDIAELWVKHQYPDIDYESPEFTDLHDQYAEWLRNQGIMWLSDNDTAIYVFIGPNDMDLAQRLCKAGPEHRKFLRQIQVCVDITAPLYW